MNIVILFLFVLSVLHITVNALVAWQQVLPTINVAPTYMMVSDSKGTLVMVQSGKYIYNSAVGSNQWDRSNYNYSALLGYVCIGAFYYEGQFLVYTNGVVLASPNGKVFTEFTLDYFLGYNVHMLVNNGTTVFVSLSSTTTFSSYDGFHWNSQPFANSIGGPIFGTQSVLFVQGDNSKLYMTTDGYNYTLLQISSVFGSKYTTAACYDGAPGEIIAFVSSDGYNTIIPIFSSHDKGISWSFVSNWISEWTPRWFGYINNTYINQTYLMDQSNWLMTSSNLTTWTNTSQLLPSHLMKFQVVDNELYVLLRLGYSYTSDLNIWFNYSVSVELFNQIYVLPDKSFVLESQRNYTIFQLALHFFSTQDGTSLNQLPPPPFEVYSQQWEQDNTFYFLLGDSDILEIWATTDFHNWTLATAAEPCQFTRFFVYADGQQLGACLVLNELNSSAVALYQASKPNQWNLVSTSSWRVFGHNYDLAYGNKIFVYVLDNTVQTSTDGIKWTMQTVLSTNFTQLYSLNNLFFLIEFSLQQFSVTKDGKSWTPVNYPVVDMFSLSYSSAADLYFAFGSYGEIATSTDGVSWSQDGYNLPTYVPAWYIEYNGETWLAIDEYGGLYTDH